MDILPPLLPDLASQLESYLLHPELLPIHDTGPAQQFWPRRPNPLALLPSPPGPSAPLDTRLRVVRDPCTGHVTDFEEIRLAEAGTTAKNSTSLRRAPGPPEETTRGSATNYPFWPGGFDLPPEIEASSSTQADADELDFSPAALLHCPPGFEAGIDFFRLAQQEKTPTKEESVATGMEKVEENEKKTEKKVEDILNLASILYQDGDILDSWQDLEEKKTGGSSAARSKEKISVLAEAESLVPDEVGG
jgi:antiviral helicase SKI2